jgi:hypothetical protein
MRIASPSCFLTSSSHVPQFNEDGTIEVWLLGTGEKLCDVQARGDSFVNFWQVDGIWRELVGFTVILNTIYRVS